MIMWALVPISTWWQGRWSPYICCDQTGCSVNI